MKKALYCKLCACVGVCVCRYVVNTGSNRFERKGNQLMIVFVIIVWPPGIDSWPAYNCFLYPHLSSISPIIDMLKHRPNKISSYLNFFVWWIRRVSSGHNEITWNTRGTDGQQGERSVARSCLIYNHPASLFKFRTCYGEWIIAVPSRDR